MYSGSNSKKVRGAVLNGILIESVLHHVYLIEEYSA